MDHALLILVFLIGVAILFDFLNGLHDAANSIATIVATRVLPPVFAVGWAAMVGWLAVPRAEGDYLISSDLAGYAVLGLGLVLLVVGIVTLPRPKMPS